MPLNTGKKRSRSNNVAATKKRKTAVNPFEVRLNRKKHEVIGQKNKSDAGGRPGLSRSKAIEKRKKTLLKEYKERNKSNSFVDRRFGEHNEEMSVEEKMLQRFAFQKKHRLDKSSVYNLESEELTHHGKSIHDLNISDEEVTKATGIDSEEDDTEEHFAGFLSKAVDRNVDDETQHPKSKKEAMAEVVTNSKIQKFQKQEDHLLIDNLVSKLDSDWKDVHSILLKAPSSKSDKPKVDPYDVALQELLHEGKSKVSKVSLENGAEDDKTDVIADKQSSRHVLTHKEMDRAIIVFQARLKAEYKLFVKTKTWSHTQVMLFRMIRTLFSTSTSEASSIIPAAMFLLGKMLEAKCPVDNCYDAMLGLLTCAELIEFIMPSSQFAPEVINFLCAVLSTSLLSVQESASFYDNINDTKDLCVVHVEAERKLNDEGGVSPSDLCCVLDKLVSSASVTKSSLRIALLKNCIILLTKVATLYHRLSSYAEIFTPLLKVVESCEGKKIPKEVKEDLSVLKNLIADHSKQCKKVLTMLKQNPKSIKFYEPKFDETYEVGKRKVRNKKVGESSKLKYKVKKETKGAIRELRKDNTFLARQQLTEQLERDEERKKRVQEIFSLLQTQQAEAKREKRAKK